MPSMSMRGALREGGRRRHRDTPRREERASALQRGSRLYPALQRGSRLYPDSLKGLTLRFLYAYTLTPL